MVAVKARLVLHLDGVGNCLHTLGWSQEISIPVITFFLMSDINTLKAAILTKIYLEGVICLNYQPIINLPQGSLTKVDS
jgi:hypothetical protein